MMPPSRRLLVRLPEGVSFSYELADLASRFCAWIVDVAVVSAAFLLFRWVFILLQVFNSDLGAAIQLMAYFVVSTGYSMILEWLNRGQTLGKRLFHLRVLDLGGGRLSFSQAALRNLLRFVDRLPVAYGIGGLSVLFSGRFQRLGDLAAHTVVARERQFLRPDWEQAQAGQLNSLRKHLRLAARLRGHSSPREAEIALRALLRREHFEPKARVALFRRLAAHFKAKAEFPAEDVETMPDEQFVRNVVDLLYSAK